MYIPMCTCSIRRKPVSGWGYARNPFGRRQREYRTVALAGTQFLQEGKLTAPWSEKNIREQAFVTEYIGGCLRERGVRFTLEGPYTATAGELAHLKTDIRFRLSLRSKPWGHLAGFAPHACRMRVAQGRGFPLHPVA